MNDRFKFRVWDKGNKRYQGTQDWQPHLDTDGDVCFINTDDVRNYPPENYFIIEQCTALKDKNGNLIYEGDIVKISVYGDVINEGFVETDTQYQGIVVWARQGFYVEVADEFFYIPDEPEDVEIIGNIHEKAEQKDVK